MKHLKPRVLALLLALVMALGTVGALAESMPADATMAYLEKGGTLRTEASIQVNPQLAMMIAGITGQPVDESSMNLINTLTGALSKLKLDMLSNLTQASGTLGTEKGELFNFQAFVDPKESKNQISTNLLPGMLLQLSPEMMGSFTSDAMMNINPADLAKISGPYVAALTSFGEEISGKSAPETGTFAFPAYGTFEKKTQIEVTVHQVGDLLNKLAEVYKNDPASQQFIKNIMMQSANENPAVKEDVQEMDPAMLAEELQKTAASMKEEENFPIFQGTLYQGENSQYLDGLIPGEGKQIKLDLFSNTNKADQGEFAISGRVIVPGAGFDGKEPAKVENWDSEEQAIQNGERPGNVMIKFNMSGKPEGNAIASAVRFDAFVMGMNIGLNITGQTQKDKVETTSKIELFVMSPEPMATINFKVTESQEAPAAPLTEGATMVTLSESDPDEETNKLLNASLQKGMGELMERIKTALPEEGPTLLMMLQSTMQQVPTGQAPEAAPAPAPGK